MSLVNDSRIVRAIDRALSAAASDWHQGVARALLISALRPLRALDLEQRMRAIGWAAVVAVLTHVSMTAAAAPFGFLELRAAPLAARLLALGPVLAVLGLSIGLIAASSSAARSWAARTGGARDGSAPPMPDAAPPDARSSEAPSSTAAVAAAPPLRSGPRRVHLIATLLAAAALMIAAIASATRVTGQWTTAPQTVPVAPATGEFVWTSRGGLLTRVTDRPTRFDIAPADYARIYLVRSYGTDIVDGPKANWFTDPDGNVTVLVKIDRPGQVRLTATDIETGLSRTATFSAR